MPAETAVAVLGAGGSMGFGLARNIARAGISVRAWNRTKDKAEPLAADGAVIAHSAAAAAEGAGVVAAMLPDAGAVLEAMEAARSGAVWLQMSTIGEEGTEQCLRLAGERGLGFVDAPVLGTKQPAQDGTLVILASGPDEPYFQLKTKAIAERGFEPQFRLRLAAKDARLMEDALRDRQLELPLVTAIARQLARAAADNPDKDTSASYLTVSGQAEPHSR